LPVVITPGDNWVQFVDSASGLIYAAPFRSIAAVQLAAAQSSSIMPTLIANAAESVQAAAVLRAAAEEAAR
jgi:hypothetical protein